MPTTAGASRRLRSTRVGELGGRPIEINRNAPATAEGELQIAADPPTVFAVIAAIDQWPSWNPGVPPVSLQGPVQRATVFRWKAGPSSLTSTLQAVDPPHELAWTGTTMGIKAVQASRQSLSGLRGVTLAVRFGCELAMQAALAFWGFHVGDGVGAWVLGLGAPWLAAIMWGALVAPRRGGRCRYRPGW